MNRKFKLTLIWLLSVALVVFVCYFKIDGTLENTYFGQNTEDALTNIDSATDDTFFNALLVGSDKSGKLTDAIMLLNVNKQTKTIRMLSIPRDTKVTVGNVKCKINSCYARGGMDLLLDEVKQLTNAPINYYAVISPGILAQIVDCLGGVEYDVEQNMKYSDPAQDLYIDLKAGPQILDGDKAEQYCRFRSYVMGDIERTRSQQKFFKALFEQKLNVKNVTKIKGIFDIVSENVKSNVSYKDVISNLSVLQILSEGGEIECIEAPGKFNDMRKEGVSYYLIINEDLKKLREICKNSFNGYFE